MDIQLGVDTLAVGSDGVFRNHQLLGDARHGIASGDKLHDLGLACG